MRILVLATALSLVPAAPFAQPAPTGTIHGEVKAFMNGDPIDPAKVEGGLWVYLVDKNKAHKRDPALKLPSRKIEQSGVEFKPHAMVVPKGTEIEFPNLDHEPHNVFSPDPYFDLGKYNHGVSKSHPFTATGPEIEIYCDIHKCMWARVKVVDVLKPDYIQQVVTTDGKFAFTNLPPGTYEVYGWAVDSKDSPSGAVQLTAKDADVSLAAPIKVQLGDIAKAVKQHTNKLGDPYGASTQYQGRCP